MKDMLDARKRGDHAFREKDFKTAIDCYSQVLISGYSFLHVQSCFLVMEYRIGLFSLKFKFKSVYFLFLIQSR